MQTVARWLSSLFDTSHRASTAPASDTTSTTTTTQDDDDYASYSNQITRSREKEYPSLSHSIFLDNASAPPAPLSLLTSFTDTIARTQYTNPHSSSHPGQTTAHAIARVKRTVLRELFGVGEGDGDGWELIFTSGATEGLRLVGECFDYARVNNSSSSTSTSSTTTSSSSSTASSSSTSPAKGQLWVWDQSHTSLLGVSDYARARGTPIKIWGEEDLGRILAEGGGAERDREREHDKDDEDDGRVQDDPPRTYRGNRLITLPAQCNASGHRPLRTDQFPALRAYLDRTDSGMSLNIADALNTSNTTNRTTYILWDTASLLSSSQTLPLSSIPYTAAPDFLTISFYKLFGFPTGLGALLVKTSSLCVLEPGKVFYGGGTVRALSPGTGWKVPRVGAERWGDGTPDFYGIVALGLAFGTFDRVYGAWEERRRWVRYLMRRVGRGLGGLRWQGEGGRGLVTVYTGSDWFDQINARDDDDGSAWERDESLPPPDQGPIINFNLVSSSGHLIPPEEVDRLASVCGIQCRVGRHCNPGFVVRRVLPGQGVGDGVGAGGRVGGGGQGDRREDGHADDGDGEEEVMKRLWDRGTGCDGLSLPALAPSASSTTDPNPDSTEETGIPIISSSIRISIGVSTTIREIDGFVAFLRKFFLVPPTPLHRELNVPSPRPQSISSPNPNPTRTSKRYILKHLTLYPIKSCAPQSLPPSQPWILHGTGLAYDRAWILVDKGTGKGLSQKKVPRMCLVRPRVDLERGVLRVELGGEGFEVALNSDPDMDGDMDTDGQGKRETEDVETCRSMRRSEKERNEPLNEALSRFLDVECYLSRPSSASGRADRAEGKIPLLFSNESPFLLVNEDSVDRVSEWMREEKETGSGSGSGSGSRTGSERANERGAKASSFRANFIMARSPSSEPEQEQEQEQEQEEEPFVEDTITRLRIGSETFLTLGPCRRCQMVSIDQDTGELAPGTFKTIARKRRDGRGRIVFGMHLMWHRGDGRGSEERVVASGMEVEIWREG